MRRTCLLVFLFASTAGAADWPMYRHDPRRSNVTAERIDAQGLEEAWVYHAPHRPRPAWPGPARWDAYVKRLGMASMRNYDESYQVTVVGDSLYYGSSADDAVHCLDARSGREKWRFTVGGPVRIPPAWWNGKLYFGSDDGAAYCLDDGGKKLLWTSRPKAPRYLLNDGRLICLWPCRTGVLVEAGIAYFGASLLPWEKSYLSAVDAASGEVRGKGTFVREVETATLEGALLATEATIIATQGRAGPRQFDRTTGKNLGNLPSSQGGSFGLVSEDGYLYFGPGPKEGFVSEADSRGKPLVPRKFGATALISIEGRAFVLERAALTCFQRTPESWLWRRPADFHECLIAADDTLFVGGEGQVAAVRCRDGRGIWRRAVDGRAQGLAIANGSLYVSTDRGSIYCFRPGHTQNQEGEARWDGDLGRTSTYREPAIPPVPSAFRAGPSLQFSDCRTAVLRWKSMEPCSTTVAYGLKGNEQVIHDAQPRTEHEARLGGLLCNEVYLYSIAMQQGSERTVAGPFECDTHFNDCEPPVPHDPDLYRDVAPKSPRPSNIEQTVRDLGQSRGMGLVIGAGDGQLAYELARRTNLNIVGLETDANKVAEGRRRLQAAGVYGQRLTLIQVDSLAALPLPNDFANLVVAGDGIQSPQVAAEMRRVLRPGGHLQTAKPFPPGSGEWSHQYGRADNATYAGEELGGARYTADFEVRWIGWPGPRFQSDRQNRKPSPLCTGGRLFVQGLDRLAGIDAYNGVVLWQRQIPDSRRFNMRNDSSNWCADEAFVYLAVRDECWQIDATDGRIAKVHQIAAKGRDRQETGSRSSENMPEKPPGNQDHWGYVGSSDRFLVGSSVKPQSSYKEFWGGKFWYTDPEGPLAAKVSSDALFAIDKRGGSRAWTYRGEDIINTTITLSPRRAFFLESPSEEAKRGEVAAAPHTATRHERFLVALDLQTGARLWRQSIDLGPAATMLSMAYADEHLVIIASYRGQYNLAVLHAGDGSISWKTEFPWEAKDKGGDSARPAIVEGTLYVSPRAFDLKTGKDLPLRLVRGACGSYAAAQNVFVCRLGDLGLWAPVPAVASRWTRLRPDCWLSAIPAAGLILAPEGGGGCSCGGWIEASIAFAPKKTATGPDTSVKHGLRSRMP